METYIYTIIIFICFLINNITYIFLVIRYDTDKLKQNAQENISDKISNIESTDEGIYLKF